MSNNAIRILIADDAFVVREGLRSLIRRQATMTVVGEACNGLEAVDLYFQHQPDLLILDLRMPLLSGLEVIQKIRSRDPEARIIVLSSLMGDETIHSAIESGALGYLLKEDSGDDTIPAIKAVMEGKRWLPPEVKEKLRARNRTEELSTREKEILDLLARGEANKQIGGTLGVREQTVKTHVKNILAKLQVRDRTEAAIVAIRRGIIREDKF